MLRRMTWLFLFGVPMASHILFVLFLRHAARYFRSPMLAQRTRTYLALFLVFTGFGFLALFLSTLERVNAFGILICMGLALARRDCLD